jgi:hypothetical protein
MSARAKMLVARDDLPALELDWRTAPADASA